MKRCVKSEGADATSVVLIISEVMYDTPVDAPVD